MTNLLYLCDALLKVSIGNNELNKILLITLIIFIILIVLPISSEVIYLTNGNVIDGKILEDTGDKVSIMTASGKLTIQKNLILKIEGSSGESNLKLEAQTLTAQRNLPMAIAKYDEYLQVKPDDTQARATRDELVNKLLDELCLNANNLLKANRFEEAIVEYEKVLSQQSSEQIKKLINQKVGIAYANLAQKKFDMVLFNEAKDLAQKALTYDDKNIPAKKLLSDLYLQENNPQAAKPFLEDVVKESPDETLKVKLAETYLESGEDEKAFPLLISVKDSIQVDSMLVREMLKQIYYNRYSKLTEEGKFQEALEAYTNYFNTAMKNSDIYEEYANVYQKAGQSEKYYEIKKKALEVKAKEERDLEERKQRIIISSLSSSSSSSSSSSGSGKKLTILFFTANW